LAAAFKLSASQEDELDKLDKQFLKENKGKAKAVKDERHRTLLKEEFVASGAKIRYCTGLAGTHQKLVYKFLPGDLKWLIVTKDGFTCATCILSANAGRSTKDKHGGKWTTKPCLQKFANAKASIARHFHSSQHRTAIAASKGVSEVDVERTPAIDALTDDLGKRTLWIAMAIVNGLSVRVMRDLLCTAKRPGSFSTKLKGKLLGSFDSKRQSLTHHTFCEDMIRHTATSIL
jgi:hypothetical protein